MSSPLVGLIMGSTSDWETMQHAAATLAKLGVPIEKDVVSAHRTPDELADYARPPSRAACASSSPARAAPPISRA